MAKGNLLLGRARGSIGDITLTTSGGQQIARARARKVANPRSDAQNIQRMVLATVTGNAAYLRDIIDHSFQAVSAGQDSYNHYNSINLSYLKSLARAGAVSGWRIKGANAFTCVPGLVLGSGIITPNAISWPSNTTFAGPNTGFTYTESQAAINNDAQYRLRLSEFFGAEPGDEIALVMVAEYPNEYVGEYDGYYQPSTAIYKKRLVFKKFDENTMSGQHLVNEFSSDRARFNTVFLDYSIGGDGKPRTLDDDLYIFKETDSTSGLAIGLLSLTVQRHAGLAAAALFISRPDNKGGWYNSRTTLSCNPAGSWGLIDEIKASDIAGSFASSAAAETTSEYYLEQSVVTDTAQSEPEIATLTYVGASASFEGPYSENVDLASGGGSLFIKFDIEPQGHTWPVSEFSIGTLPAGTGVEYQAWSSDGVLVFSISASSDIIGREMQVFHNGLPLGTFYLSVG